MRAFPTSTKAVEEPGGMFGGILGNLGWLLAGKGVGAVLSLVYLGLAARTLGAAGFGQFALIVSTGQAVAALVGFQTWQIVARYGAPLLARRDRAALARLFGFCALLDLAAALAGCALSVGCVLLLSRHFAWGPQTERDALAFCLVLLLSIRSTSVGILRLYDRFDLGAASDAATPVMRFAGALAAVLAGATVERFLLAWAAAEIATAAAYWVLAYRVAAPLPLASLRGAPRAAREHAGIWPFTWTTNVSATLTVTSRQMAVVLVGVLAGPVAAGDYRLAYQLSQSLVSVSDMAARAAFAEFTRFEPGPALRLMLRRLTWLAAAAGLAGALVLVLGGPALSAIAGQGHHGALVPMRLLAIAAAIDLAGVGFEPVLLAAGRAGLALVLRLGATLCLIMGAGVLLVLPIGKANAVAAATLVASACALGLFGMASLRLLRKAAPA